MNLRSSYGERFNETSNTVAGINTPKDHEAFGPLDMLSGAVEKIVDNVQHEFDDGENDGDLEEVDEPERDHHDHLRHKYPRYDRHSY
ncbi:hypothetical protein [Paenibacillus sp. R14(2021)]|uniref:hypothetical protein n=1 Tax=Paenibacillus sp. R14(2021) TaxID=2859228 RepID=UPI001C61196A|nr:hypothetical protein [Paenibacillus sp. R14(2021)]